jgi:thioesterase domain-containing protein
LPPENPHAEAVQQYLGDHIPLSVAMGVRVSEATPLRITLSAPLAPNINHRDTAFGGSAAALAMLSAWALLHLRLEAERGAVRVVVQRCEMRYERPIPGDFAATCELSDEAAWSRFETTLERRGRARIELTAVLTHEGKACAFFHGDFVAVKGPKAEG